MAEKLNFEESMLRLEEIARKLESGKAGLDELMELYTQAAKLIASCQKKLDTAQLKIEKLNLRPVLKQETQEDEICTTLKSV